MLQIPNCQKKQLNLTLTHTEFLNILKEAELLSFAVRPGLFPTILSLGEKKSLFFCKIKISLNLSDSKNKTHPTIPPTSLRESGCQVCTFSTFTWQGKCS